jgi:hypothetical protein
MPLKPLDFPLMLLGGLAGTKCAKVTAVTGVAVRFARVKPIFARFEFANHKVSESLRFIQENRNPNAAGQARPEIFMI